MAIIKFKVFDKDDLMFELDERWNEPSERSRSSNIFPKEKKGFDDLWDRTNFLEKGISRNGMRRFEDLTATVGINNVKECKYILKHGFNWAEPNWTKEICIFCFNFLIDSIIKHQGENYVVRQSALSERQIVRARDNIDIYNQDKVIYTLPKGETTMVWFLALKAGQWEIYKETDCFISFFNKDGQHKLSGFFEKKDINKFEMLKTVYFE